MAKITAPSGKKMPDTDNPGLLAYYERRGYSIDAGKRGKGKGKQQPTQPEPDGQEETSDE